MDKKRFGGIAPVGAGSLLVSFAVLCLTVFALLCLTTARRGERLSRAYAQKTESCYEAEGEAEELLARLRAGDVPEGVAREGALYCFACPISQGRSLTVCVRLAGGEFEILRWQSVSTEEWDPREELELWDGNLP